MLRRDVIAAVGLLGLSKTLKAEPIKSSTGIVLDSGYSKHLISHAHPEKPIRYQRIVEKLHQENLLAQLTLLSPNIDVEPFISLIHNQQHISSLKQQNLETHRLALLATSGLITAVSAVCNGQLKNAFCVSRPPGHHALNTGREEGFCYYNHIAIAARYAQQQFDLKKILIVDWDYHHGNGTEAAFYDDPSILFFSTHDQFAYPGTGSENEAKTFSPPQNARDLTLMLVLEADTMDFEWKEETFFQYSPRIKM